MSDAVDHLREAATYCRPNDEKRPSLVGLPDFTTEQVCPDNLSEGADEVTNAYPDGWYVRIMFDELLDPTIEELTEILDPDTGEPTDTYIGSIANTRPVTLRCESINGGMVNVDYDGYYSPSGNRLTWPLGPSIVIKPNDPTLVATNTPCEVEINDNVVDKSGEPVPAAQRGPYKFRIAPIQVLAIDPSDDPDGASPVTGTAIWFDNVYVQFNTFVDPDSFCDAGTGMDECEYGFLPETGYCSTGGELCHVGGDACPTASDTCEPAGVYHYSLAPFGLSDAEFGFGPNAPVKTETDYTFSFFDGATLKDRCGRETTFGAPSAAAQTLVHFTTAPFAYQRSNIASGETSSGLKKLQLFFTNVVAEGDVFPQPRPLPATTLDPADWTLSPMPFDADGTTALTQAQTQYVPGDFSGQIYFRGHYQLDTTYTFTLKAGAVVTDPWGATYTQAQDRVITWKTQPAITITGTSPADRGTVTKATPASAAGVAFSFNQSMNPATFTSADYEVTDSMGNAVTMDATAASGCGTTSTSCSLAVRKAALAPGTYKFTLKAGAEIEDVFGNVYTQAAERVINFTVVEATSTPVQCL